MIADFRSGACKMTGGKLVTVDLRIADGKLLDVRFRGDFFVDPESATRPLLDGIGAALHDLPSTTQTAALAAHIAAAVPHGTELIGTNPEAMAIAVRRAVTGDADLHAAPEAPRVGRYTDAEIDDFTKSWKVLPWRLLPEVPLPPALNVALDEVLTERVSRKLSPPVLRFWRWTDPAVILGRSQSLTNEVQPGAAREFGVAIVRRMTGGGAMFLQPEGAITYSLYLPEAAVAGLSIRSSYEVCEAWLIRGLRSLGVDAHHVPINDIACSEGKIGGAAQARRGGVVLHHTTLAYDMDLGRMVQVLRIGREKLKDKGTASAAKRVSPLVRQTGLSRAAVVRALFEGFRTTFGGTIDALTADELAEAADLVRTKYGTPEWTAEFE